MILHNQTDFRRGMGTINNVYVLNYVVGRQLEKRKGKLVVLFADLKTASDMVDKEVFGGSNKREGGERGIGG